jgi:hypothetical protein
LGAGLGVRLIPRRIGGSFQHGRYGAVYNMQPSSGIFVRFISFAGSESSGLIAALPLSPETIARLW